MNLPLNIAWRISKNSGNGYSASLVKLAIGTISISIIVMLLASSVIKGFKNQVSQKVYGFWGHIHISDTQSLRNFEQKPFLYSEGIVSEIESIKKVEYSSKNDPDVEKSTIGGVYSMHSFITLPTILDSKKEMEGIVLKGLGGDFDKTQFAEYLVEGDFPTIDEGEVSREVLVSKQTARRLSVKIGDKVNLLYLKNNNQVKRQLRVSGLYKSGLEEYDTKFAFVDIKLLRALLDWSNNAVGGYEILIESVEDAPIIADYIYNEILPSDLYAETIQEKQASIFEWLELQDINESATMFLMGIVALINMTTILMIIILERSRMIGVLKSLGMADWTVRRIFIYISVFIMVISLLLGNLLGLGLGFLQKSTGFLKLDEANYYLSEIPIEFDWSEIFLINLGTILLTAIVMILPTFIITKITPISILRFE